MFVFHPDDSDVTVYFRLRDDDDGLPKTGLVFDSAGVECSYTRAAGLATTIALITLASANSAHADGGFKQVDSTKAPGLYRLDLPDAVCAQGVPFAIASIKFDDVIAESVLIRIESNPSGSGSIEFTITVNNDDTGNPIAGASVWVTTDAAGTNVIAGTLATDAAGQVTFFLDAGTAYVWVAAEDYTGTNPTQVTVS